VRTKGKRKLGGDESIRAEEEGLRGSLPGLSGKKVLQKFAPMLSEHQKIELINEKTVYYLGVGSGAGEDDLEGRYIWRKHEQLGWRYELLEGLGRGAFGEVVRAVDHKSHEMVAVKIVRAGREHMQLALNEINILMKVKEQDIENKKNLLRIRDFIVFRRHICIITELLATSLYQLLEANHFAPLDPHNIRAFAIQLLASLAFLRQLGVIHSDIKPENVLMKHRSKVGIKLVDFGTSMFAHEATFSYIQSRFYRAPEVILGGNYSFPIDMWSFGCLIAELHLGYPLFAGDNEQEQLSLILRAVGPPTKEYLLNCKHAQKYFGKDYAPKIIKGKDGKAILPSSRLLPSVITDPPLAAFLEKILRFDPAERLTPLKALIEPWVLAYFPEDIKK
jgi:dual specificity tyrosine-phosphorylation-regulated kinase 2/3/4